jgi:hypothetical protein
MMESFSIAHESCRSAGYPQASAVCPGVTGSTAQSTCLTFGIAELLDSIALKTSGRLPPNNSGSAARAFCESARTGW